MRLSTKLAIGTIYVPVLRDIRKYSTITLLREYKAQFVMFQIPDSLLGFLSISKNLIIASYIRYQDNAALEGPMITSPETDGMKDAQYAAPKAM